MMLGQWHGASSYLSEANKGCGWNRETLLNRVELVKSRGILVKPDLPKRSPMVMATLSELGGGMEPDMYRRVTSLRTERHFTKVASYKRGSGEVNALAFAPNSLKLCSMHTTKSDTYNEAGNFLICDLDFEKWDDDNEGSFYLKARYGYEND